MSLSSFSSGQICVTFIFPTFSYYYLVLTININQFNTKLKNSSKENKKLFIQDYQFKYVFITFYK